MPLKIPESKRLVSLNDMIGPLDGKADTKNETTVEISINRLVPFSKHPFQMYEGSRLDDMVRSIKELGVLTPLLVREVGLERYEILSGHNRWNAGKLAGLEKVPVRILKEIDDDMAMLIVTETNLIQRAFSDLLPSERSCVLAQHYDALKKQGKRMDLINTVRDMLNTDKMGDEVTSCPVGNKLKSSDILGQNYDMSGRTVARYLRINTLSESLKQFVDTNNISIRAGVEISYISEANQSYLAGFLNSGMKVDLEKAKKLHQLENKKTLSEVNMQRVLDGTYKPKKQKSVLRGFKIKSNVMKRYFKEGQTEKEVEEIIDKALEFYYQARQGGGDKKGRSS